MDENKKKAFTLIELIVVIAIIAVLAAIIAPNAFKAIEKAKISATASDMKAIKTAVLSYYVDTGVWPARGGVQSYIIDNTHPLLGNDGLAGWDGPYLEKIARSSLAKGGSPGCPYYGYYYVYFRDPPDGEQYFDLNNDGTAEVTRGISVCVYGFAGQQEIIKLDGIFDGDGRIGIRGIMTTYFPGCGDKGIVALFIAEMP